MVAPHWHVGIFSNLWPTRRRCNSHHLHGNRTIRGRPTNSGMVKTKKPKPKSQANPLIQTGTLSWTGTLSSNVYSTRPHWLAILKCLLIQRLKFIWVDSKSVCPHKNRFYLTSKSQNYVIAYKCQINDIDDSGEERI